MIWLWPLLVLDFSITNFYMKKLLKYLRNYKKESILSPLFKMLEASFELIVPLVVAGMIDRGIGSGLSANGDTSYLIRCFFILIALGLIGFICACTAQYFAAKAATGFSTGLRHDLFRHLLGLSYSSIDNIGTSTMITRMTSDVNTIQNGVNMFLRLFLRSPFIVLGAMVMAFTIDIKAASIFVVVIAILSIVVFIVMRTNIPMLKKVQGLLDSVLNLTRENLSGARVIRAFTKETDEYERFTSQNAELTTMQLKAGRVSGLLNPLTYIVINVGIVVLISVGGYQVNRGILSTGQVVALYNYMSQILVELIKFATLIISINKALASANRIVEVFNIPVGMEEDEENKQLIDSISSIEFKNVSLRYHENSDESLTDVSFRINAGETLGVIGGTGSGKSSLVNLIPRFYDASSGEILINDIAVRKYDTESLRKHVGVVMQKAVLFKGTIRDNLLWGSKDATDEDLLHAINMACADDVLNAKGGLDALIEAGGKNLSGGQRQRLTIARALVKKPDVLILDDASSALDYVTDLKLRTNIKNLKESPIVVIVSQRTSAVKDADHILVLDDGIVVGAGKHDELLKTCEVYKEIYDTQFKKEVE